MKRIFYVAAREFAATVMTRGFIIGMLITPLAIALVAVVFPRMINRKPPKVEGQVAIIDPTGEVADSLRDYLRPERFAERNEQMARKVSEAMPKGIQAAAGAQGDAIRQSMEAALGEAPRIDVVSLPVSADIEGAKSLLKTPAKKPSPSDPARLALVVVHDNAVKRAASSEKFGSYDLYVRGKIDDRIIDGIRAGLRDAIVAARVRASGLDRSEIESLTKVDRPESRTVTAGGERATNEAFNMLLPAGFMILLLISVMTGGQYLLTTTVEEKSNRVVEVLLSAVSAMELMAGKILGQLTVGFLVLAIYAALGIAALVSFAMLGLLDGTLIAFLVLFYLFAYFTIGSFMAAIGSAVNEMREAQTMMGPVMMVVMLPWILWMPITREPNSALAVTMSFIPPLSNFVMLLRMASNSPPPAWQIALSILIGAAGAYAALWFAAKVFRVGLLMYGKPPNLKTLVRWARMS